MRITWCGTIPHPAPLAKIFFAQGRPALLFSEFMAWCSLRRLSNTLRFSRGRGTTSTTSPTQDRHSRPSYGTVAMCSSSILTCEPPLPFAPVLPASSVCLTRANGAQLSTGTAPTALRPGLLSPSVLRTRLASVVSRSNTAISRKMVLHTSSRRAATQARLVAVDTKTLSKSGPLALVIHIP
jgi:hypothetical protein